ncbi:MAG: hypothetical protein IT320_09565 [Anaerolineae bacterium]|nr:hypothetical protein [Anaerolineae bacterium]
MDLYSAQKMSEQKIKHFHDAAEHERLVHVARGDAERKPRHLVMLTLIAFMTLVSRSSGAGLS